MLRRSTLLLSALLLAASVVCLTPLPAEAVPPTQVGQRYEIEANVDLASGAVDVVVEAELTNRSRWPMRHAHFALIPRAQGFVTAEGPVSVDGAAVDAEWVTSIALRIPLDVAPGRSALVRIPFSLEVGLATPAFTARTSLANGVLSLGQWFPILSTRHEVYGMGDSTVTFSAERIRLRLTTGTELPRDAVACPGVTEAPEMSGSQWTCEAEDVRDLSVVINPRFRLVTRDAGGTEVRAYVETVDGARTADLAVEGLAGMEDRFGDYPWPDLVLAEVGSAGGFSMEYPRQIHLTRDKVTDPYVIFHEVAHQWFYALVGSDQQAEPWLDEAWADFSARLLMGIGENACGTLPVDSPVFAWPADAVTGGDWTSCDGYFHSVFYRGSEFLTAVRTAMGDEGFFDAVRSWLDAHRHGFASGRELLWHLQRSTDADLGPIYAAYLAGADPRPFRSFAAPGAAITGITGRAAPS
ncbi:MAG TPA: M1 family aminopeptidase [Candidatus Angelobacter sp.]|nr:M1 family aminopeptidase [Candidatus Angelobacter sp.]